MKRIKYSNHISSDEFVDYFEMQLSDSQEKIIEEHVADCDQCTEIARQINSFLTVWNQWTAEHHGLLHKLIAFNDAFVLAKEQVEISSWRDRLEVWQKRWSQNVSSVVKKIDDFSDQTRSLVGDRIASLIETIDFSVNQLIPQPVIRTRGIRTIGTSRGQGEQIRTEKINLTIEKPVIHIKTPKSLTLEVTLKNIDWIEHAPLVLLVTNDKKAVINEAIWKKDLKKWIVIFPDIEPGTSFIALEPI